MRALSFWMSKNFNRYIAMITQQLPPPICLLSQVLTLRTPPGLLTLRGTNQHDGATTRKPKHFTKVG